LLCRSFYVSQGEKLLQVAHRGKSGRSDALRPFSSQANRQDGELYWLSSPPENGEFDECSHEGVCGAGEGVAQLEAEGSGAAAGASAGLGAAFLAGAFLAAAFLADFFGAAFFADFLAFADFFADFLADFLTDFLADFLDDFFFAASVFLLLAFLPFFFLPLAIVILLLSRVYRALRSSVSPTPVLSNRFWPGTTCCPIEKLNRVHYRN
jgi:hypothetical protein